MSDVRWEGYSHDEIYARVQQGPGRLASADAEAAWSTVESTIRAVDAQLTQAVNRIGAGWQGRAADAVHGGMTVMSNWALDAAGDATLTRNGITAQADQAARLRTAMPPPRTAEWGRMVQEQVPAVGLMSATGDLGALEERMANDRAVAVDLMNRYSSQSSDNQRMMNYWTQPPTVVVEAVAPGSSTSGARAGDALGAGAVAAAARPGAANFDPRSVRLPGATARSPAARHPGPRRPAPGAAEPLRAAAPLLKWRPVHPGAVPAPRDAAAPERRPQLRAPVAPRRPQRDAAASEAVCRPGARLPPLPAVSRQAPPAQTACGRSSRVHRHRPVRPPTGAPGCAPRPASRPLGLRVPVLPGQPPSPHPGPPEYPLKASGRPAAAQEAVTGFSR